MESREIIVNKIKKAIEQRPEEKSFSCDFSESVHPAISNNLLDKFIEEFSDNLGEVFLFSDSKDFAVKLKYFLSDNKSEKLFCIAPKIQSLLSDEKIGFESENKDFEQMDAGLTECEFLIARTGSIMVSSAQASGRAMNVFPPCHIIIASKSQLVAEINHAITAIQKKYNNDLPSMISTITGPSRTADIEKTLVMGAHGPKQLIVFININK